MVKRLLDEGEVPKGWVEMSLDEVENLYGNFPIGDMHQILITEDGTCHFLCKLSYNMFISDIQLEQKRKGNDYYTYISETCKDARGIQVQLQPIEVSDDPIEFFFGRVKWSPASSKRIDLQSKIDNMLPSHR